MQWRIYVNKLSSHSTVTHNCNIVSQVNAQSIFLGRNTPENILEDFSTKKVPPVRPSKPPSRPPPPKKFEPPKDLLTSSPPPSATMVSCFISYFAPFHLINSQHRLMPAPFSQLVPCNFLIFTWYWNYYLSIYYILGLYIFNNYNVGCQIYFRICNFS